MWARGLLVLLVFLNLGVAGWWWRQPVMAEQALPVMQPPPGVPVLQLVVQDPRQLPPLAQVSLQADSTDDGTGLPEEAMAGEAMLPDAQADSVTSTIVPALACVRVGVFTDEPALVAARSRLMPLLSVMQEEALPAEGGGTWRVMLPPAPSREQARQMVERIVAAGFSDYFIIHQGDLANAIALGQYRSQEGAQRRLQALNKAGFPAQIVPSQASSPGWNVRGQLMEGVTPAQIRAQLPTSTLQSIDCAVIG